jgi:ABC-type multidrug transport system fused ATPase/permease subunit
VDVVAAIASFFADLMPYLACWRAARILHLLLLDNVLKAPLQFFEVTPVGRILSRFSKDVDVLDTSLPSQCSDTIFCAFEVICVNTSNVHFMLSLSRFFGGYLLFYIYFVTV